MSAPDDRLLTCSQRPVPDECAHRIAHDLRQKFLSGLSLGLPMGVFIAVALFIMAGAHL